LSEPTDTQPVPSPASPPATPPAAEEPQAPERKSFKVAALIAVVVSLLALAGIAIVSGGDDGDSTATDPAAESKSETHEVAYSIVVDKSCADVDSGYDDISQGTEVEVVDGSETLLGIGELNYGTPAGGYGQCRYLADRFDVKKSEDGFYRVTSGNSNRGYLNYTEDDFEDGVLTVTANLG